MNYSVHLTSNWLTLKSGEHYLYVLSNRGEHLKESGKVTFRNLLDDLVHRMVPEAMMALLGRDEYAHLTLIYIHGRVCLLKSDIIRTYPVLYSRNGDSISVSDHLVYDTDEAAGSEALLQMAGTGMVFGDNTVYDGIKSLQAGEMLLFNGEERTNSRFFSYACDNPPVWSDPASFTEAGKSFDRLFQSVMQEIIDSIPEHGRIVIPLSGGHDSRLLVNYLYRLGYRNVLCYTYGTPGNLQASLSRRVATALGYEWIFIEYTEAKWEQLNLNRELDRYLDFAFRGTSTPHIQDFLAVYEMKQKQILQTGDVFIPGHALDFIVGSHIKPVDFECTDKERAVRRVVHKFSEKTIHGSLESKSLGERVSTVYDRADVPPDQFQDYFNWQERQAKFIANSFRVYEYFGYETRIPFWDIRLIRFWLSVDPELKMSRKFFFDMEKESLLADEIIRIPFFDDIIRKRQRTGAYKKMIPAFLVTILVRILRRKHILDEGLNMIFALRAGSVGELIGPADKWPANLRPLFENDLKRYPYQTEAHFLTGLYTIRKLVLK
ncbi:MAG: hypothetical protein ACNA8K_16515 [Cyclonatronaceae bacterium]